MHKTGIVTKLGSLTLFLCLILFPPSVLLAQQSNLTLILDASGSMWGKIDGKTKIGIAKEVMEELINGLPDTMEVGLVAYGHRRKGDCKDVEELVKLSRLDKKALINKIRAIQPKGKTPMALALKQTVSQLKDQKGDVIVVLVSDGKETCDEDPCGIVSSLKKANKHFKLYVIGFDVTKQEREQLDCMARAGGGVYYAAKDADELKLAARQVVMKSQNFGELEISPTKSGHLFKAFVAISNSSDGGRVVAGYSTDQVPFTGKIPPGTYDVIVKDLSVVQKPSMEIKGVNVKTGETTQRSVEFAREGELRMQARKMGKPIRALYRIYKTGEKEYLYSRYTKDNGMTIQKLLEGSYDVCFQDRSVLSKPERWARNILVKADEPGDASVEFPEEGVLKITATMNGSPARVLYIVYKADDATNRVTQGYTNVKKGQTHRLLPGRYRVQYIVKKPQKINKDVIVEVQSGQTASATGQF
jgi:Ca-activated chloride channel homolog